MSSYDFSEYKNQERPKYLIPAKCVVIGPAYSGKTSLAVRLVKETFSREIQPTLGSTFLTKTFNFSDRFIKLEIWDTAGQERFSSCAPIYFRASKLAMVVFDLSDMQSFGKCRQWIADFKEHCNTYRVIALVGNKSDLKKAIDQREIDKLVEEENMIYFEASAKDNINVTTIFETLASKITLIDEMNQKPDPMCALNVEKPKKKGCCK